MPSKETVLAQFQGIQVPIERYLFLRKLLDNSPDNYYRLLVDHTEDVLPYIYTPTVGEACEKYHVLPGLETRGLYITLKDKGNIQQKLKEWPQQEIRVIVVTDGERILGLGDLGAGGMGISEGKITLYTVAAGVDPSTCLPICLDVGTNNKALLVDPKYYGLKHPRITGQEYDAFLKEFMDALIAWRPHVLVQYEDFGNTNAFRLLEQYRGSACVFNDDIQGTAAITLAALLAAVKASGTPLSEQRVLFSGAGEAGTGIGELIAYCVHRRTGVSLKEARQKCFFMDSKGLVCASRRSELQHHKLPFAHDIPACKTLIEAVRTLKPTALIGVSTMPSTFTQEVIHTMANINRRPIIFPLSNPTSKSECTFEEAVRWSDGRVLFASGSPYEPVLAFSQEGNCAMCTESAAGGGKGESAKVKRLIKPAQANNAYVFPAIGLAAITTQAARITDECFLVAAEALADLSDPIKVRSEGALFPPFSDILNVSTHVAAVLARHMCESGLGVRPEGFAKERHELGAVHTARDGELGSWMEAVRARMWKGPSGTGLSHFATSPLTPEPASAKSPPSRL